MGVGESLAFFRSLRGAGGARGLLAWDDVVERVVRRTTSSDDIVGRRVDNTKTKTTTTTKTPSAKMRAVHVVAALTRVAESLEAAPDVASARRACVADGSAFSTAMFGRCSEGGWLAVVVDPGTPLRLLRRATAALARIYGDSGSGDSHRWNGGEWGGGGGGARKGVEGAAPVWLVPQGAVDSLAAAMERRVALDGADRLGEVAQAMDALSRTGRAPRVDTPGFAFPRRAAETACRLLTTHAERETHLMSAHARNLAHLSLRMTAHDGALPKVADAAVFLPEWFRRRREKTKPFRDQRRRATRATSADPARGSSPDVSDDEREDTWAPRGYVDRASESNRRGLSGYGQSRPHAVAVMLEAHVRLSDNVLTTASVRRPEDDGAEKTTDRPPRAGGRKRRVLRESREMLAPPELLDAALGALARDAVAVPIAVPAAHVVSTLWSAARHGYRPDRRLGRYLSPALERDLALLRPVWDDAYSAATKMAEMAGEDAEKEDAAKEDETYYDFAAAMRESWASWEDEKEHAEDEREFSFSSAASMGEERGDGENGRALPTAAAATGETNTGGTFSFESAAASTGEFDFAAARERWSAMAGDDDYAGRRSRRNTSRRGTGSPPRRSIGGGMLDPWLPAQPWDVARLLRAYAELDLGMGASLDHLSYLFRTARDFLPTLDAAHTAMLGYALVSVTKNPARRDAEFHAAFARHVRDGIESWECTPHDLAVIARVYGALGPSTSWIFSNDEGRCDETTIEDVLDRLCERASRKVREFSNAELATFAWSVAAAGHVRHPSWNRALVNEVNARGPGATRHELCPGHLSCLLWACVEAEDLNLSARVDDALLVNAVKATCRNKRNVAPHHAAAVLWCAARLKTGDNSGWGDREDEKNKWIGRAQDVFRERHGEATPDEQEAARWAFARLKLGKGTGTGVGDESPASAYAITSGGRLERKS